MSPATFSRTQHPVRWFFFFFSSSRFHCNLECSEWSGRLHEHSNRVKPCNIPSMLIDVTAVLEKPEVHDEELLRAYRSHVQGFITNPLIYFINFISINRFNSKRKWCNAMDTFCDVLRSSTIVWHWLHLPNWLLSRSAAASARILIYDQNLDLYAIDLRPCSSRSYGLAIWARYRELWN